MRLYPSLVQFAAIYAFGRARNHAFADGNKRTAFVAALTFLEINGVALTLGSEWIAIMEGVAAGTIAREHLVACFMDAMPARDAVAIEP